MVDKLLLEYKEITEKAIEDVDLDKDIEEAIEKREEIIEKLKKEDIIDSLRAFNKTWDIEKHEKILLRKLEIKKNEVKKELDLIKRRKLMRNNYSYGIKKNSFLNKKI
ncbi:hypothetical protein [Clostridium thermobutyricum]|uniref:hypothetical protein n=1 Tax=Clostridium thermobutyricum TaxID=29372 RepID=UPI003F51EB64